MQILQGLPWDPLRDFTPILHVTGYAFATAVRAASPWHTRRDFVEDARRRPGALTYGSTGANGTLHVGMLELCERERIELVHVPFRGEADGTQALLGGHIDLMAAASGMGPLVEAGQARWMNVWTVQRLRRWPEVPTLVELGYGGMVITSPYGIAGPAGMDAAAVRVLHDAFAAAIPDPLHLAALERYDMSADYKNSADYVAFLRELHAREVATVRRFNLRAA